MAVEGGRSPRHGGRESGRWSSRHSECRKVEEPSAPMPLWPILPVFMLAATPLACLWYITEIGIVDMPRMEHAVVFTGIVTAALTPVTVPFALLYPIAVSIQRLWRLR